MVENHYYADVNLPNHVWVREGAGSRARWVLKDAAELDRAAGALGPGVAGGEDAGSGRRPAALCGSTRALPLPEPPI
jgi:hypothetical protein